MDDVQKYQKAFNQGYVLAEHAPTLMESLKATVDQSNEYLKGILSGGKQYEIDKAHEHDIAEKEKQAPKNEKDHDLDVERDHS